MSLSRRRLLGSTAVGLAVGGVLPSLATTPASAASSTGTAGRPLRPFPPLKDDPNGILALPEGFSYKIVTREGVTDMSFGQGKTPGLHDGAGVVSSKHAGFAIILNHELGPGSANGVPLVPGTVYDPGAPLAGGCTVVNTGPDGGFLSQWVGISGTVRNCAGGVTPWGTWLTCEESSNKAGSTWSGGGQSGTYQKDHGYVFEVYPTGSETQLPKPIKAFGRYDHEALAVEPKQRRVYLSEDASGPNGLFYRWTASQGKLEKGFAEHLGDTEGTLEAMQIRADDGSIITDVSYITSAQLGRPFNVTWIAVPDRDAKTVPTRQQFAEGTVTRGKKFEGVWSNGDGCYIVNSFAFATADLPPDAAKHDGMVWFYDYKDETITLVTYFPHNPFAEGEGVPPKYTDMTFDGPDNVTVTPWGTLVLAEDGVRASHVLSSVPGGPTYAIARNQLQIGTSNGQPTYSEFTGPTFSPDGKVLFVNIQTPGIQLAITGPWQDYLR
ncbi:alkaline phosphatase PhoX [Herbidospora mongoliensis]|uniref:alkaline phosphatase PhoX n=1 Tax=Herbidospora mongoliensis TaxID=688067 RepID=UPI00082B37AB|nr:alkaline phosphatase PhoX [Herbidospora mongoliensis]